MSISPNFIIVLVILALSSLGFLWQRKIQELENRISKLEDDQLTKSGRMPNRFVYNLLDVLAMLDEETDNDKIEEAAIASRKSQRERLRNFLIETMNGKKK